MSKSTTTFNGRGFPEVSSAHHTIAGATATIKTSSVTQIASIFGNSSFVQMSHNSSSPGTPVSKMLLSSHRVNAGIAIIPSKPNPSRTDRVPSSSLQNTTQTWTSPNLTGIDISAHSDMESPVDNLSPRQMGAIIGGSVGVTAIILVAIAVFFVLQRRRRGRYALKQTTKLSSEKKGKIGKARQLSSYGLALSTNQTSTTDVFSDSQLLYHGAPLPTRFKRSNIRSFSYKIEHSNKSASPTFAHCGSIERHNNRHLGKSSLPGQSRQPRHEVWRRSFAPPNFRESVTRNSNCITSMDFPDPLLDSPRNLESEISSRCPSASSHDPFYQSASKRSRRSMSVSSMPDNGGGTTNLTFSETSYLSLNFCSAQSGTQSPVPLHMRRTHSRAPYSPQRNDSVASQIERDSASSGSVIILPGRMSAASSEIFDASASDISLWRRNRSPREDRIDTRRSDPFDLESLDSSSTGDKSTF
ncbi:predicted protein [Histoplasma capsulatum H143]|uniref:Uncharacterized protein n=1 Tax=Ajellomyces capsulatus (strain H143) TaxID=544712 RepID=C6HTD1_AJECH|nr:predicted protein [Histoplasma capsulatum H143]